MNYEKLPKTISAEELLSTPLPPVKWIIPDLLPAGLALFAGPSKAGKSWLTLWLCLQVAQGKPMWGREIEPHTVLYLSLEDTFNRLQKRLLQLVGSEEAPERLVMQTECGSIGQGLEEQLTNFIYQHPDTGLIVIDTLQKVRSNDQNNSMYASDYKEISALKAQCLHFADPPSAQTSRRRSVPADCRLQRSDGGIGHQLGHAAQTYEPDRQHFGDRARYGQQNTASARGKLRLDSGRGRKHRTNCGEGGSRIYLESG